jgi:phospholipid-binding lipoprotein MlaA
MTVTLMAHARGGATASRPGVTDPPWRRERGTEPTFRGVTALVGPASGRSIPPKARCPGAHPPQSKGLPRSHRRWTDGTPASGIALALTLALAACAHAPADPEARADYERINDPAEPTNRVIFAGNKFVDDHALQPVARSYQDYVPGRVRKSVHNFVGNLGQPSIAVNDALQGNFSRSWNTIQRFAINTTVGGVGVFDVATDWNRPGHLADFGQTFGVWGAGPGPSVQLPIFGPSSVRDSLGKVADLLTNPANLVSGGAVAAIGAISGGAGLIDGRANLLSTTDPLERHSLDYYAALRSITAQRRAALVAEGKAGDVDVHKDGVASAPIPVPTTPAGAAQ